jgi:hypothetical protein
MSGDTSVPHPWWPWWQGQRSWTPEGEPPSDFMMFDTEGDEKPIAIEHNRDMMFSGGQLEQDYNFLDYRFAGGEGGISARAYLYGLSEVSLELGGAAPQTAQEALALVPEPVLRYLQKRYGTIKVLTRRGHETLWTQE